MDLWQLHDWYKCWRFSFMKPLPAFSQFSNQTNQTMFRFSQMLQKSKSCTVWTVRASCSQNCSQKSFLCGVIPSPLFKLLSLFCRGDPITFLPDILSSSGEQCSALGTRGPAGATSPLLPGKSVPWDALVVASPSLRPCLKKDADPFTSETSHNGMHWFNPVGGRREQPLREVSELEHRSLLVSLNLLSKARAGVFYEEQGDRGDAFRSDKSFEG